MEYKHIEGTIPVDKVIALMRDEKFKILTEDVSENIAQQALKEKLELQYKLLIQHVVLLMSLGDPIEVYDTFIKENANNDLWAHALKVDTVSDKVYFTTDQIVAICEEKKDRQICEAVIESGKLQGEELEKVKNILAAL